MTTGAAEGTGPHDPEPAWVASVKALEGAYADDTIRACIKQFRRFEQWCVSNGRSALPATAQSVAAHVLDTFPLWSTRTVQQRFKMIRRVHELMGEPAPTRTETVQLAFRQGLRADGRPPRQARPLNAAMRDRLLAACGDDLRGLRDRVIVSVGYDMLCRCCELVALQVEDFTPSPTGRRRCACAAGRGIPRGRGQVAFISRPNVAHIEAWRRSLIGSVCAYSKRTLSKATGPLLKGLRLTETICPPHREFTVGRGSSTHRTKPAALARSSWAWEPTAVWLAV